MMQPPRTLEPKQSRNPLQNDTKPQKHHFHPLNMALLQRHVAIVSGFGER